MELTFAELALIAIAVIAGLDLYVWFKATDKEKSQ